MSAPSAVGRIWTPGLMSSLTCEWATPRTLYEMLDREFHFTLDVCTSEEKAKCVEFFSSNALTRPWVPLEEGTVWCNPPYGRGLGDWVEKAYRESVGNHGTVTVVMLLPARTDTQWFHAYVLPHTEIRFIRGRVEFDGPHTGKRGRCPFLSMIVIFKGARWNRL